MSKQLDEIEARAQRHLDGMTVNRDAMANDVIRLARALRRLQSEAAKKVEPNAFADMLDKILKR